MATFSFFDKSQETTHGISSQEVMPLLEELKRLETAMQNVSALPGKPRPDITSALELTRATIARITGALTPSAEKSTDETPKPTFGG